MSIEGETSSNVLEAVRGLASEIAARADETEERRSIAPDLVKKMRVAGVFRMMVPRAYGGEELTQLQACRVIQELARADGAAGWTAMVAFGFNIAFSRLPKRTLDELFSAGPDVLTRGALAPIGKAVPAKGGYVISGKWPFASGPYKPQWVAAGCIVMDGSAPRMGPTGMPVVLTALLPGDKAQLLDTWYSVGLRGSDSTDIQIDDQFVPEGYTTNIFDPFAPSSYEAAQYRLPFGFQTGPTHSAVCLGIVQGALDDLGTLARTKRGAFTPTQRLAEDPVFQHRFGELLARQRSIHALTDMQVASAAQMARTGDTATPIDFAMNGASVGYVHVQSVDIVNEAFSLAGSTPVYSKSVLQRRWRDVRCVAQHFGGSTAAYRTLGGLMAGETAVGPPTTKG